MLKYITFIYIFFLFTTFGYTYFVDGGVKKNNIKDVYDNVHIINSDFRAQTGAFHDIKGSDTMNAIISRAIEKVKDKATQEASQFCRSRVAAVQYYAVDNFDIHFQTYSNDDIFYYATYQIVCFNTNSD
jgi:regulatory protein YycI of two-component signal transduction system YycFG